MRTEMSDTPVLPHSNVYKQKRNTVPVRATDDKAIPFAPNPILLYTAINSERHLWTFIRQRIHVL